MKLFRPLWNEGVFLTPQQFQQQTLWQQFSLQKLATLAVANPWGIESLTIDTYALSVDRLQAESINIRFPDGVVINTDVADKLPEARILNIDVPPELDEVTVFIGIPLLQANGGNCLQENQRLERPLRFRQEWVEVPDLLGQNVQSIAVEHYALTFLFDFENQSDYLTCPVARLKRDLNGRFVLDLEYLPPSLNLFTQSGTLVKELELLCIQMQAKRHHLMGMRHERNQQIAEFATADVSLFWLLNALNTYEPQIRFFRDNPSVHPEKLYQTLTALTGALLTFSLLNDVDGIPAYQHNNLNEVFPPLFGLVRNLSLIHI